MGNDYWNVDEKIFRVDLEALTVEHLANMTNGDGCRDVCSCTPLVKDGVQGVMHFEGLWTSLDDLPDLVQVRWNPSSSNPKI